MLAYKVLTDGRSAFTGWQWPLPTVGQRGEWVRAAGRIELCVNGIHASNSAQLPQWLGMEIWEIELGGEVIHEVPALVASQGRLLRKVDAWDEETRTRFAQMCLDRAREIANDYPPGAELVAKVEHTLSWGGAAPAGYFTAMLAGQSLTGRHSGPEYDSAVIHERDDQARWLRQELALTG